MSRSEIPAAFRERVIAQRWREFHAKACEHFLRLHEPAVSWFGKETLKQAALEAVEAARRTGNKSHGGMLDYLTIVYLLGREFEIDAQYRDFVEGWITSAKVSSERLYTEFLITDAIRYAESVALAPHAWAAALDAADAAVDRVANDAMTEMQVIDAVTDLLREVWPQRLARFRIDELAAAGLTAKDLPGDESLLHGDDLPIVVRDLNQPMGALGVRTPGQFAAGALLALRFGRGFARDPRYAPFVAIARQEQTASQRLHALLDAARDLNAIWSSRA